MKKYPPPKAPFVEAKHKGGAQIPTLLVAHSTVTATIAGSALAVARYFHQSITVVASAHYIIDEETEYQGVHDHTVAYHCGYNQNSIALEMCDDPSDGPNRWVGQPHVKMLERTAQLTASLCLAYRIPVRYLTDEQLAHWGRTKRAVDGGIVTHAQMSKVFKKSTHWDPGEWPRDKFLQRVKDIVEERTAPVASKKKAKFKISTVNIKSFPGILDKRQVWQVLKTVFTDQLIGFQECDPPAYKEAILKKWPNALGIGRPGHVNSEDFASPLVPGRHAFEVLDSFSKKINNAHPGLSKVRHLVAAKLKHKRTGFRFGAVNLHGMVVNNDQRQLRLQVRHQVQTVVLETVRDFVERGLPVAVMGDFNDIHNWFGTRFEGHRVQRVGKSIDQIILIDGDDLFWTVLSKTSEDQPSDHDTLTAKVQLAAKRK